MNVKCKIDFEAPNGQEMAAILAHLTAQILRAHHIPSEPIPLYDRWGATVGYVIIGTSDDD